MMLAIYLAKEVAAILRAILTHPTKKLYDDRTAHLLCSNYWMQPIFQELLHSSSRYNATRTGERNRPSSGLARISAHPRPPKKLKPSASGTRFTDWIGGICYADTLQVWFPAHWAPVILRQLQDTEDAYRAAHPSWMDLDVAPDDIKTQWQEANANRRMQFKVGVYKDSNIRMLTGTIKADWIQLPVERYLTALPTLKQGVIAGVFKNKGAAPWAITRAEKLQLSVFLPNNLSLDDWYAGVYALPTVWPDVSMLGANNLCRVVGYDFHRLRKKYDVLSMWGNIHPQWRLLQQHLETKGPGWYPLSDFFWAHAVHARGSDGHQNVLSLISYSHILENRWKQKARCLPDSKQNKPNQKQNQNINKKTPRELGETLRFQKRILRPLSTSSRCHSKSRK